MSKQILHLALLWLIRMLLYLNFHIYLFTWRAINSMRVSAVCGGVCVCFFPQCISLTNFETSSGELYSLSLDHSEASCLTKLLAGVQRHATANC